MASKHQKEEQRRITAENEKIKTQIAASVGIARSIVQSWLPPPKPGESLSDEEDPANDPVVASYSTGRPDRLGLGAKFLSHKEAMRHQNGGGNNDESSMSRPSSKQEMMLKNKILNQNRKGRASQDVPVGKRRRPGDEEEEKDASSSDEEEESRSTVVGSGKKAKKGQKTPTTATTAVNEPATPAATNTSSGNNTKKKIGQQGDFLSMYLSERANKKQRKKKTG